MKLECKSITGAIKARTAVGLLTAMAREQSLIPGTVVVESTWGNLGLALALLLNQIDCHFVAVVDPRTPPTSREELAALGAAVVLVDKPDRHGGYLGSRLREVARLLGENPEYRWPDQYHNPANSEIHARTTGPEIADQGGPDCDAVYVAVSTGGTLAGISAHLRRRRPDISIVAVDSPGSCALAERPGRRLVPGIGSGMRSRFLDGRDYDRTTWIGAAKSFAMCRILYQDLGIRLGGSSGSVVGALVSELSACRLRHPICVSPDGGDKYLNTFYGNQWLAEQGLIDETFHEIERYRTDGLNFYREG